MRLSYSMAHGNVVSWHTVWPEILAVKYFGRLLKLWQLAEFTLVLDKVLAIMIFMAKWLIERAGNDLTGPWASFNRLYHSNAEAENRLPIFLGKWPTTTPALIFTATACKSFGSRWQTNSSPTYGVQNPLETWYPCAQLSMVNSMPTIHWRIQLQAYCTHGSYDYEWSWQHTVKFWQMKYWQIALKAANLPK